ncbi:MAG: Asp23/Gls24 family envelope stress response protein [Finegoldia sp.]|nr:Asp23/Gls24 family envelope stress response protein [Finegoldia sp.]
MANINENEVKVAETNNNVDYRAYENASEFESKLTIEDKVIAKVAGIAVRTVDGVLDLKGTFMDSTRGFFSSDDKNYTVGITVESGETEAKIDVDIILEYGKNAREVFEEIKKVVKENVKATTGIDVVAVNVNVEDLLTKQEYQKNQKDNEAENNQANY